MLLGAGGLVASRRDQASTTAVEARAEKHRKYMGFCISIAATRRDHMPIKAKIVDADNNVRTVTFQSDAPSDGEPNDDAL